MRLAAIVVSGTVLLAGCAGVMGERAVVTGVGQGDLLKLRYGPSLGYKAKLGLPDGTEVVRRTCVTEMGQLWCEVSLAKDPGVTGYVSADYLTKP